MYRVAHFMETGHHMEEQLRNGTQLTSFNGVKVLGNEANATSGSQGGFSLPWQWIPNKYFHQLSFFG